MDKIIEIVAWLFALAFLAVSAFAAYKVLSVPFDLIGRLLSGTL